MDDELIFRRINDLSTQKWLEENIVLNRQFLDEAKRFSIKPLSNQFWVYRQHRQHEKFGKFGWCVAGVKQIAEDCGLTERQTLNAYHDLMEKKPLYTSGATAKYIATRQESMLAPQ